MTTLILISCITIAYALHAQAPRAAAHDRHSCGRARAAIGFYRDATWRWQTQRDARRSPAPRVSPTAGCRYVRWVAHRWQARARVERGAFRAWLLAMLGRDSVSGKWGCIHSHEAAWNDHGLPQMGGLQFDPGFQGTYGPEFLRRYGDAGNWPIWAQLVAAERAYHGYAGYGARYFNPWPNTAAACGLR